MGAQFSPNTPLAIKRGKKRIRTVTPARLLTAMGELDIRLRDLSRAGALGEAPRPPVRGSSGVVLFGDCAVPALVAWVAGRRFGLEFEQLIGEDQLAAFHSARLF